MGSRRKSLLSRLMCHGGMPCEANIVAVGGVVAVSQILVGVVQLVEVAVEGGAVVVQRARSCS